MGLAESVRRAADDNNASAAVPEDGAVAQSLDPFRDVFAQIRKMEPEFAMAAPRGQDPAMFAHQVVRDAMTAIRGNPDLLGCEFSTILGALMTCAQLGFRPGVLGEAYIVPYAGRATFVIGYRGLVQLCHRTGKLRSITARTVGQRDEFSLVYTEDRDRLSHTPYLGDDVNPPLYYYARAVLTNGGASMTRPTSVARMIAHRDIYAKAKNGPWYQPVGSREFNGMAHKTELRRLCPLLPMTAELAVALATDGGVRTDPSPTANAAEVTEPEIIDTEATEDPRDADFF